jgi:hypothetical protein
VSAGKTSKGWKPSFGFSGTGASSGAAAADSGLALLGQRPTRRVTPPLIDPEVMSVFSAFYGPQLDDDFGSGAGGSGAGADADATSPAPAKDDESDET